jgi:urease subunit beta
MTVRGGHASDDPGRRPVHGHGDIERHPSSGKSASSPPRRPGLGERQAPRRQAGGDETAEVSPLVPGEVVYGDQPVTINGGADVVTLRVVNTADRPIQVGSHFHFAEVNAGLEFDRGAAWGCRLNVLSGGSMRFEPGTVQQVELVPIRGARIVAGLRGLCGGPLDG